MAYKIEYREWYYMINCDINSTVYICRQTDAGVLHASQYFTHFEVEEKLSFESTSKNISSIKLFPALQKNWWLWLDIHC